MTKMRDKDVAKKRFQLIGAGKIKKKHAVKSHSLNKKTTKQKRNLTYSGLVATPDEKRVKALILA